MAKGIGIEFEEKTLRYLRWLFKELGFEVVGERQQETGTQNGFDLEIQFLDDKGRRRRFFFECKEYTSKLNWKEISSKIVQLSASRHPVDCFIAISPYEEISNIGHEMNDHLPNMVRFPIQLWTPGNNVKEYFSLDDTFYESVYGNKPAFSGIEKESIRQTLRAVVLDILRKKDEMADLNKNSLPKELTLKIPRVHPDDIIGREDDLEELHQLLFNNQRVVVVNGLGGIGKTTLAQVYLSKYFADYKHIAWVTQLSEDVANDIVNAGGLAECLNVDKQGKEVGQLCQELLHQLKAIPDGPNLLILDNASTKLSTIKEILPGQPGWHVLVTSRERIEGFYPKALDFLSPEQAVELFKKHCVLIKEEGKIAELVKVVDYHTLTIEILAKTAQLRRVKVEVLKEAIKEDLRTNVYVKHKGEKIDKVRSYLASIFNLSNLTEDEVWLMKQFVCMPAEYYPYDLLVELIDPDDNMKEFFSETLAGLVEKGWLLHNPEADAYKMHVIVQEVAGRQLLPEPGAVERLMAIITRNLSVDETQDNPVDKFMWIPYGRALLHYFPDSMLKEVGNLQNNLATVLRYLGNYAEAKDLLEKTMVSGEHIFGPDHSTAAIRYSNLALVLQDLGDYAGARVLLEKAMVSDERHFGPDHPTTAITYSNLALVLKDLGDYARARVLLEKAVVSDERNFGPDHPFTSIRYSCLALVLKSLGDYAGAKVLFEKAMVSNERHFGPNHPTTAKRYSNLATVLQDLGDYAGARGLLEKAVLSDERNFGPDHPATATRYSNLAGVLQNLGDYAAARALLEKAMVSDERNFGHDHPTTAIRYSNLAMVLKDLGDYAEARVLLEKAVLSDERNLEPDHPAMAIRYSNLALVLKDLGDYAGARVLLEKAMVSNEHNFGPDHPTTAISYSNLAMVLQHLGDYAGAMGLLEKSIVSDERNFGTDNPNTAIKYLNLASVLDDLGDYAAALELAAKSLAVFQNKLPEGHPHIKTAQNLYDSIKAKL